MSISFKKLPKIESLSFSNNYDDIFISMLGFEKRTKAAIEKLDKNNYKCKNSILLKYNKNIEENKKYYDDIKKCLENITLKNTYEIIYDLDNLNFSINNKFIYQDKIIKLFNKYNIKNVSIDISSCNTSSIIQLIDNLFRSDLRKLRIIYTTGKEYPIPKKSEFKLNDYKLYGVKYVRTLKNFTGIYTPGYSPLYIFILGIDPIRTISVLRKYRPTKKIGILGKPDNDDLMWRLEIQLKMYNELFNSHDEIYKFPSFNYKSAFLEMEKLYLKYREHNNITIIPLGNKMQTLAVLLLLEKYRDIKLLLTIPYEYNSKKSAKKIDKIYEINFKMTTKTTD